MPIPSLFHSLRRQLEDHTKLVILSKGTLVHLSHTLEDMVLRHQLPAMLFTGFQESSHWRRETLRYRQLSGIAKQVCIFAGKPLPLDSLAQIIQVELTPNDPLQQEWFLLILSEEWSVVLAGEDQLRPTTEESHRQFEVLWSFEPRVIQQAMNVVEDRLRRYLPDRLAGFQTARQQYGLGMPHAQFVTELTAEMLNFENRLEQQLRLTAQVLTERENLYQFLAQSTPMILLMVDAEGLLKLAEGQYLDKLLPNPTAYLEQTVQSLPIPPTLRDWIENAMMGERIIEQLRLPNEQPFEFHLAPLYNVDQELAGAIAFGLDIRERLHQEKLERESLLLQQELDKQREMNALKNRLMTVISHEFRTPLAMIMTATELLDRYEDKMTAEQRRKRLHSIQSQVLHLKDMLDEVTLVIENSINAHPPQLELLDLQAFIQTVVEDHQILNDDQIPRIQTHFRGDLAALKVDRKLMMQIVGNLLSNALKYSPVDTFVELNVWRDSQQLTIKVKDYGIGIPALETKAVFEPFYRANNIGNVAGTGLGLGIIQDAVSRLNGRFKLISPPQGGTVATVTLPIID